MISQILAILFKSHEISHTREDDQIYIVKASGSEILIPTEQGLSNLLKTISKKDTFILTLTIASEEITLGSGANQAILGFLEKVKSLESYSSDGIQFEFEISKGKKDNSITIYSLESFSNTLENSSISQIISIFSRSQGENNLIWFETIDSNTEISTSSILISNKYKALPGKSIAALKAAQAITFSSQFLEFNFTPEDFSVDDTNSHRLKTIFDKLNFTFSIIYLFDITHLNGDILEYKINGYKSYKDSINIKNVNPRLSKEYNSIYKWVYEGGNLNDKIGLARNLLSLNITSAKKLTLNGSGTLSAIKSGFKVYEKQNIKQYVEIRNKVTDQLTDFNERANKIIENFSSGFQKSIFGLITFYTSAIVIKVLGSGNFVNVFTIDASIISTCLLSISVIYFIISRWEVRAQKGRFQQSYKFLKTRYEDLLEKEDIKKILNDDREFTNHINFIDNKLNRYSWLWGLALSILLIMTWALFIGYNS